MRSVDRIQDLNAIFDDDVDAVIWRRSTPSSVGAQLSVPRSEEMEGGLFEAAPGDVGACIKDLFVSWGWAIGPAQRWLADDAESLAVQLAQILSTSRVRLRVEWVRDDACRKFHRDWVRARLICTYCGPGTEYGPADGGDRPSHVEGSRPARRLC